MKAIWSSMKTKTRTEFSLRMTDWATHGKHLYAVRFAVFVAEQGVPEDMEQDADDLTAWHGVAWDSAGSAIGTGRLLTDGHIGRLAVLQTWRGRGVGTALMRSLLAQARVQKMAEVVLHAQTHALDFYTALGFTVASDEFLEAGIPHRIMRLRLDAAPEIAL